MTTPYAPQPGTIPHRAIQHLSKLPPGTELSTAVLAEALGQTHNSIHQCLQLARNAGLLAARQSPHSTRRIMLWRLPQPGECLAVDQAREQLAAATAEDDTRDPLPVRQTIVPASPRTTLQALDERPRERGKRIAIWSTGELAIETEDNVFIFNPREARQVIALVQQAAKGIAA